MKASIQKNYRSIRELIKSNVDTIITLVEQAQELEKIVDGLGETDETSKEMKEKLENQIAGLRQTIGELVGQTETLFESYDEMVQTAFK